MARYIRLFSSGLLLLCGLGCGITARATDTVSIPTSHTPHTFFQLEYQPSVRIQPKSHFTFDIQSHWQQTNQPTDSLSLSIEQALHTDDTFPAATILGAYNRSKLKRWITPGVYWKPVKGMEVGAGLSFGLGDNDDKGKGLRLMTRFKYQWR